MRWFPRVVGSMLLAASSTQVQAQNFPTRPITLVVAAAAGGTTDVLARLVAKSMTEDLKQSVIVENVVGGGATVGTRRVVRSEPDGYSLIFGNMGSLAANVSLFPQLGFDPRTDLAPIGVVANVPMVLAVSKKSGVRDLAGFMAKLKASEKGVNFGHSGPGTTGHIGTVTFLHVTGTKGVIDAVMDQTVTMIPLHTGGSVTAIGVANATRLPQLPDVPTFVEGGAPQFDFSVWNAIAAPAATPKPILDRLEASLKTALRDPELQARFAGLAAGLPPPEQQGAEPLRRLITADTERLGAVIKAVGLKVE